MAAPTTSHSPTMTPLPTPSPTTAAPSTPSPSIVCEALSYTPPPTPSSCLDTCGACYDLVSHTLPCVSNITQCPYELNYYGGLYSQYMFYSFAEECPLEYCYRTQDTAYSATCLDGDLANANCCPFVYEDIAGYTPVSLVMANGVTPGREYARVARAKSLSRLTRPLAAQTTRTLTGTWRA